MKIKVDYTHKISWVENHPRYGTVEKSFPTTKDAVNIHLSRLKKSKDEGLVVEYKVERYETQTQET